MHRYHDWMDISCAESGTSTPESALTPEEVAAELRKFGSFKLKDVQPTTRYASCLVCSLLTALLGTPLLC